MRHEPLDDRIWETPKTSRTILEKELNQVNKNVWTFPLIFSVVWGIIYWLIYKVKLLGDLLNNIEDDRLQDWITTLLKQSLIHLLGSMIIYIVLKKFFFDKKITHFSLLFFPIIIGILVVFTAVMLEDIVEYNYIYGGLLSYWCIGIYLYHLLFILVIHKSYPFLKFSKLRLLIQPILFWFSLVGCLFLISIAVNLNYDLGIPSFLGLLLGFSYGLIIILTIRHGISRTLKLMYYK